MSVVAFVRHGSFEEDLAWHNGVAYKREPKHVHVHERRTPCGLKRVHCPYSTAYTYRYQSPRHHRRPRLSSVEGGTHAET
mmetsp:Transcript_41251/g.102650  ORF Transcript_41251/g.102650 Transcript_41251/m.102650 type:complete len:80 (+) Transcript_41251:1402-1641(+)